MLIQIATRLLWLPLPGTSCFRDVLCGQTAVLVIKAAPSAVPTSYSKSLREYSLRVLVRCLDLHLTYIVGTALIDAQAHAFDRLRAQTTRLIARPGIIRFDQHRIQLDVARRHFKTCRQSIQKLFEDAGNFFFFFFFFFCVCVCVFFFFFFFFFS